MRKSKYSYYTLVPLPQELEEAYKRKFGLIDRNHTDIVREALYEAWEAWDGYDGPVVYNTWKYFVKVGVSEDFYRFYHTLTLAERLEFNRRFVKTLKQKLAEVQK